MVRRVTVIMTNDEQRALQTMAEKALRSMREQLRFLLLQEARKNGLIRSECQEECEREENEVPCASVL